MTSELVDAWGIDLLDNDGEPVAELGVTFMSRDTAVMVAALINDAGALQRPFAHVTERDALPVDAAVSTQLLAELVATAQAHADTTWRQLGERTFDPDR